MLYYVDTRVLLENIPLAHKILKNYESDGINDSLLPLQSDAIGDT